MKNLINTSAWKYVVNVLMIVLFAGSAITGLFFMEGGGGREGGHKNHQERFTNEKEISDQIEKVSFTYFNKEEDFRGVRGHGGDGSEGIHQISGIAWLVLMFLHTVQHLNWYKKLFSIKYIMQNKLLTGTLLLFVLLVLTSVGMWIEIIPRGLFDLKEVHSVIGQILVGFVLIHIIQRFKWYITTTQKLIKPRRAVAQ